MSGLNDYSGFKLLFGESLIGLVISLGLFNTVLPGILESIGIINELGTFNALKSFSIIYFLLPIFIITNYWFLRGHILYIQEKLEPNQQQHFKNELGKSTETRPWIKFFGLSFIVIELSPVVVYFLDDFFFYGFYTALGSLLLFLLVAVGKLCFTTWTTSQLFHDTPLNKPFPLPTGNLLVKAFRINFLILLFDVLAGIGFVAFVQPWIIYGKFFIVWIGIALSLFFIFSAIIIWRYFFKNQNSSEDAEDKTKFNYPSILVELGIGSVAICVFFIGFPALNLEHRDVTLFGVVLPLVLFTGWFVLRLVGRKDFLKKKIVRNMIIMALVGTLGSLTLKYFLSDTYFKLNNHYYKSRQEAANKIDDTKIFPFFYLDDEANWSCAVTPKHYVDSVKADARSLDVIRQIHRNNHKWKAGLINSVEIKGLSINLDSLKRNYNVKEIYYPKYTGKSGSIIIDDQSAIDTIYQVVFKHINDLTEKYFYPVNNVEDIVKKFPDLKDYYHPINYYSEVVGFYSKQEKKAGEVVDHLQEIKRLLMLSDFSHFKTNEMYRDWLGDLSKEKAKEIIDKRIRGSDNKVHLLEPSVFSIIDAEREAELQDFLFVKKKSREQDYTFLKELMLKQLKALPDWPGFLQAGSLKTDELDEMSKFFMKKIEKQIEKVKADYDTIIELKDRTFMIDKNVVNLNNIDFLITYHKHFHQLKRLQYNERFKNAQVIFQTYLSDVQRVGVYLFMVLIFILSVSLYFNGRDLKEVQNRTGEKNLPIDIPSHSLVVALLSIIILVIPLTSPIRAENINPEKPYWMMNVKNWFTPKLIESVVEPSKKEEPMILKESKASEVFVDLSGVEKLLEDIKQSNDGVNEKLKPVYEYYEK